MDSSKAQQTDLDKLELKGSVKYVKEFSPSKSLKGINLIETEFFFNRKGNLNRKIDIVKKQLTQYHYGPNNMLSKISVFNLENKIIYLSNLNYNEKDKLIDYKVYNKDTVLLYSVAYEYSNGLNNSIVREEKKYNLDKNIVSNIKEIFDSKDRIISRIELDSNNLIQKKYNYFYDKNGNIIRHEKLNSSGENDWTLEKKYDTNGFPIKNILSSDVSNHTWNIEYEFDQKDNWTKKILLENNEIVKINERIIEYY